VPRALSLTGRPVRVAFTADGLPDEDGDELVVEAEGADDESRIVRLSGVDLLRVNPGDRLVAEGTLRVVRHRRSGEFPGFVEVQVVGARRLR